MKRYAMFKVPSSLIRCVALHPSARKIAAVLYAFRNSRGQVKKGLDELATLTGCDRKTVLASIRRLEDAGYLTTHRATRYDTKLGKLVHDRNLYTLNLDFASGYTLVPYALLQYVTLTPAAFVVALYICQAAGATRRAYPSVNHIAGIVGIAKSTVCLALGVLKQVPLFLIQLCRKVNGALSCNSYWMVTVLPSAAPSTAPATIAVAERRSIRARIKAAFLTSIVRLSSTILNFFPLHGVVRFFHYQERNKITRAINLQE